MTIYSNPLQCLFVKQKKAVGEGKNPKISNNNKIKDFLDFEESWKFKESLKIVKLILASDQDSRPSYLLLKLKFEYQLVPTKDYGQTHFSNSSQSNSQKITKSRLEKIGLRRLLPCV